MFAWQKRDPKLEAALWKPQVFASVARTAMEVISEQANEGSTIDCARPHA
jgi:hypothetical protein